jgi:heme-binding NEAT domain protein
MGLSKEAFYLYDNRVDCNGNRFIDSRKEATVRLEAFKLEKAATGHIREIITIFDLKNNHGYADKQEVTVSDNNETLTAEQVRDRMRSKKMGGK